ncbi:DUF1786 domain-containing protein [Archaeoglobus veneficus]|uniref:Pyruvate formate-lyase activating enzyme n=1 Tax=Archaeoglobus veneficus (strain DSM 11195 / SNP6) TaxID=693661 RepID=F2KSY3_ARCVS|nr:DUF1786 domain-containing protein [Archaeoglobus veneficus]AEA48127.1 Domain of unknown function DUF1786 putative pyruvate format-lyase activating enzyme [Archaeoglobus veneficus SNP6]
MGLFTLDVGSGTQDFLLFKDENIRNCPKMILPSPTRIVAGKIREATRQGKDIYLTGYTMGGGACVKAIKEHLNAGLKVYAEENPALTIADDLEKVKQMGILLSKPEGDVAVIEMRDVDIEFFRNVLEAVGEKLPPTMVVAVQDHGFSPHESNRRFRFKMFERMIKRSGYLHDFLFPAEKIPGEFNRMMSVAQSVKDFCNDEGVELELYVIDTVFAAIAGCMLDVTDFPALLLNFGNSHVVGAVADKDGRICSLFEHHTSVMRNKGTNGIEEFIERFVKGEISNEDVFNDMGHGAYVGEIVEVRDIVATGPNVHLCNYRIANPAGDIMIVGNLGMAELFERLKGAV